MVQIEIKRSDIKIAVQLHSSLHNQTSPNFKQPHKLILCFDIRMQKLGFQHF